MTLAAAAVFFLLFGRARMALAAEKNAVASAQEMAQGKWVSDAGGRKYQRANGTWAADLWIRVSGSVYHMNHSGYADKGWFFWQGKRYYADAGGKVYYNRWLVKGNQKYYFLASGECAAAQWVKIGTKYYYFSQKGKMAKKCFAGEYYVNARGVRVTSRWVKKNGKKYYFDGEGKRVRGQWLKKDGKFYYLQASGAMAVSQWVGNYYVGADGVRKTNCQVGGYWLDENGVRRASATGTSYIFVGDSRMVGMKSAVPDSQAVFVAKVNTGYEWLKSKGDTKLREYLEGCANAKVVLAHGVNDIGNLQGYIAYYNQLIASFANVSFYVLSVNPVDEAKLQAAGGSAADNAKIDSFNQALYAAFGSRYIDTNTYLKTNGFLTDDGLHYLAPTYESLYNYIMSQIG